MVRGFIYLISNVASSWGYVGQTAAKDPSTRWRQHLSSWRRGMAANTHMLNAVKKYGVSAFSFQVVDEVCASTVAELRTLLTLHEDEWILALRASGVSLYNQRPAADSNVGLPSPKRGTRMSDAQRLKLAEAKRGAPGNHLGHTHTAETKAAIAAKKRGRPSEKRGTTISAEQREKLRIAHTGLVQSPEHLAARSKAIKGRSWVMVDGKRRYSPRIDVDLTFQCTSP